MGLYTNRRAIKDYKNILQYKGRLITDFTHLVGFGIIFINIWQLVGEDDNGDELHLVGTMVDKAKVEMKGYDLYIQLIIKK